MAKISFCNIDKNLGIKKSMKYGVSIAVAKENEITTYCSGSGRYGQYFPVNPDMIFQAGSVSKSLFALTLLRYVDKGIINLDEDISGWVSDFANFPLTFSALLSHTAGFNVHGFDGYPSNHKLLTLEDVLWGRGNSPKVEQIMSYGKQFSYSGGGITLAELAFTRITGTNLRKAFGQEVAVPLGLKRSGYFQPLDEDKIENAAFGGKLGIQEDSKHGYHYYPENAAAGLWTTPTELTKVGIALSRSFREGGLLKKETAERMLTPVMEDYGLCIKILGYDNAGHSGNNMGFLTYWTFSMKEDLCVAAMINSDDDYHAERLSEIQMTLFKNARG